MEQAISELFLNPSAAYRPAPLWVWNDDMTKEQIKKQLLALKSHGFGGAFVHPRPGLVTEYLSDEWFELWGFALQVAVQNDMKLYIYDENSYPSGFAGGHVPSQLPDCTATGMSFNRFDLEHLEQMIHNKGNPYLHGPYQVVRAYAYDEDAQAGQIRIMQDLTDLPLTEWHTSGRQFMVFQYDKARASSWLGEFAYVDILRPEVAEVFLQTTYEPYFKRFGEQFGKEIPVMFTDEPTISSVNKQKDLPLSPWFAAEFYKRNGYDLLDCLPALFTRATGLNVKHDYAKIRFDYYSTLRELWVRNFIQPISEWCENHGIAYTGHYYEHNWPYPWGSAASPSLMSLYEYMHWPAIDMLTACLLEKDGTDPHLMTTIREASSAANQFSRERVLCESYGAGGWDSTFGDYRRIGDWLYVHGVNFLNQHLTYSTIVGARKRDYPQSFDWRQPWWEEYTVLNDYFSRLSAVLSQGKTENRILVFNPTTSAYLLSPDQGTPSPRPTHYEPHARDERLFQLLCDLQWDYDFGDEFIMERHGSVASDAVVIGDRRYSVIIVPDSATVVKESTFNLMEPFLENGGKVLSFGSLSRIDGVPDERIVRLAEHPNWISLTGHLAVDEALRKILQPTVQLSGINGEAQASETLPYRQGFAHLRRVHPDGSVYYFFVNSGPQPLQATVTVTGNGLEQFNAWDGTTKRYPMRKLHDQGPISFDLSLQGADSILLRVTEEASSNQYAEDAKPIIYRKINDLKAPWQVQPEAANMLPIDYCDLSVDGKYYANTSTIHAGETLFKHRGFQANPWDNAVQFKNRLLDRNRFFGEGSGFSVTYRFHVQDAQVPEQIELMAEFMDQYEVEVNGTLLAREFSQSPLDHHIRSIDIAPYVIQGENTVKMTAQAFDIRMEIEPVYMVGNFKVAEDDGRWKITRNEPLSMGSWREQGYPFYPGAVCYQTTFSLGRDADRLRVQLGKVNATAVSVYVNDKHLGIIGLDGSGSLEAATHLGAGTHRLSLRVCGSYKNLFGPLYHPDRPRKAGWTHWWKHTIPKLGPVDAAGYDLIDYGIQGDILLEYA